VSWKSITAIIVAAFVAGAVLGNFGVAGAGTATKSNDRVGIATLAGNESAACSGDCGDCDVADCDAGTAAQATAPAAGCPSGSESACGTSGDCATSGMAAAPAAGCPSGDCQ